MISIELARALRTAGLRWHPKSGDRFLIEGPESGGDVFTIAEMTVEVHEYTTGDVLGFNGTTEWALDSVDLTQTLWLPREDQLREVLKGGFRSLRREVDGDSVVHVVDAVILGEDGRFRSESAEDAYGEAVLELIVRSLRLREPLT